MSFQWIIDNGQLTNKKHLAQIPLILPEENIYRVNPRNPCLFNGQWIIDNGQLTKTNKKHLERIPLILPEENIYHVNPRNPCLFNEQLKHRMN